MKNADTWVLKELEGLEFRPYRNILPEIRESILKLRDIEARFVELLGESMSKRQAVAFGLLARAYQLSISCLVNQLIQNHSGWNCSFRSLLETFFVIDWISAEPQRFEVFFEDNSPSIGRIKNECCGRHPEYAEIYDDVSEVTHVGTKALHLGRKRELDTEDELPFSASTMSIGGWILSEMLQQLASLINQLQLGLESLLIESFELTVPGETLWDHGKSKTKFGCLGWEPIPPEKSDN